MNILHNFCSLCKFNLSVHAIDARNVLPPQESPLLVEELLLSAEVFLHQENVVTFNKDRMDLSHVSAEPLLLCKDFSWT